MFCSFIPSVDSIANTYFYTITSSTNGVNLWDAIYADNDNAIPNQNLIEVTIAPGVEIGSTDNTVGSYSLNIPNQFVSNNKTLTIINNGSILGFGGDGGEYNSSVPGFGKAGGTAVYCSSPVNIINNGKIIGGGGGGGGNTGSFFEPADGTSYADGGGGAGIPFGSAGGGYTPGDESFGAEDGTKTLGGIANLNVLNNPGGDGGNLGQPGGNAGNDGGEAGFSVQANGVSVAVDNFGTIGIVSSGVTINETQGPTPVVIPNPPVITNITETSSDTNPSDLVSDDNSPFLSVTAEANGTLKVYSNAGSLIATNQYVVSESTNGNYTINFGSNTLSDGIYHVTVTNSTGQESQFSNPFTISTTTTTPSDTTPPAKPVITNITETGNDPNPNDLISDDNSPVLTVTGEAGATLTVYTQAGILVNTSNYSVTQSSGTYTVNFGNNTLSDGNYFVALTDAAGNTSIPSDLFTINTSSGSGSGGTYTYTISSVVSGISLWDAILASNNDEIPSESNIVVDITNTAKIGAVSNSRGTNFALQISNDFVNENKTLIINNYGIIRGFGGNGGNYDPNGVDCRGQNGGVGVNFSSPATFNNYGTVSGGGGGGAGNYDSKLTNDSITYYSNGGGGAGLPPGSAGSRPLGALTAGAFAGSETNGGLAINDPDLDDPGGNGGNLGQNGANSTINYGGTRGYPYQAIGVNVTWNNLNGGTIDGIPFISQ